ncbi:MAG: hypothetical protein JNL72_11470 [Flavipsychrobacter sp.]|nr:hypothetical protein [Flavipsychrobacter sp.]
MKKIVLTAAAILGMATAYAQNAAIQTAKNYLRENDYDNAVKYINQALDDPSTKDKPKTHFAKGDIYMQMFLDTAYKTDPPAKRLQAYKDAGEAYLKVIELDADYEREDINAKLASIATVYYNEAVTRYKTSSYQDAYNLFSKVGQIDALEGGKRTKEIVKIFPPYSEVVVNSKEMKGYSAMSLNKYDEALAAFKELKNAGKASPTLYISMSDAYDKLAKRDEQLAIIQEGRKAYPDDANLRNEEINFYIATDRTSELTSKLEEAVAADPNNADLHHTLANIYNNMANPKSGNKPANAAELTAKAEASYQKAITAKPDNAEYNFNFSVLYYMQAYDVVQEMNKLGETPEEMKKYKALTAEKDALFTKALPFAEKAYDLLDGRADKLTGKEKEVYISVLGELMELYGKMNKSEQYAKIKAKKEAYK